MTPRSEGQEWQSIFLLRMLGYCLLLFILSDLIYLLFPPRLMDPIWEFQTIGGIVDRMALPLIGLVLVFLGEENLRSTKEVFILKYLSWLSLIIAVLLLLLIPLCLSDTLRINNLNNTQITTQASQQLSQIQQFDEQLSKATTSDLETLLSRVNTQKSGADVISNTEDLKTRLLAESNRTKENLGTQIEIVKQNKRLELIKTALKSIIGAIISAFLLIRIWQSTRWARKLSKRKDKW
ncbi:HpsJ family protein [Aerosakkonemataceae cyanobacterium BLCC-F50]|uniref:HpsJ family protein n=1 Tax=Floridaenema flaviceps BLCC-F50 TaxID=3153642 RepID=A0ABV4XRU1_9CYAN